MAERVKSAEELDRAKPFPTFGLTPVEEAEAASLKRKLVAAHGKVADHLETVLSTDKDFYQWINKVCHPDYGACPPLKRAPVFVCLLVPFLASLPSSFFNLLCVRAIAFHRVLFPDAGD